MNTTGQDNVIIDEMLVSWKRLELKKGDVLAVLIPENVHLTYDMLESLGAQVRKVVQGMGVNVILLTNGIQLASVSVKDEIPS